MKLKQVNTNSTAKKMSLRGTAFDVELFLYDMGERGPKHKIMCTVHTKIEAANCLGTLGSGKYVVYLCLDSPREFLTFS